MYERPFYIMEKVSNNSFSFEKRPKPVLHVPALINGDFRDVKPGREIVIEDFGDNGELRSCRGLKKFVRILWRGKHVYVFDNHNHAFAFWHLERMEGRLHDGAVLIHMDQHRDSRKPERYLTFKEAQDKDSVYKYTNTVLNVGNFIPAALSSGLVKKVINVDSEDAIRKEDFSLLERGKIIFDLDMDFFAPEMDYVSNELKLRLINKIAEKADVITIATSPFFIDQRRATEWFKRIAAVLGLS